MNRKLAKSILLLLNLQFIFVCSSAIAKELNLDDPKKCYEYLQKLKVDIFTKTHDPKNSTPVEIKSFDSKIPISRAFEKEGLFYDDIEPWFPKCKPEAKEKLRARLKLELKDKAPKNLSRWLTKYSDKYREKGVPMPPKAWEALTLQKKLEFILSHEDFFSVINLAGKRELFFEEILDYTMLAVSKETPEFLDVTDDQGSYEIRTDRGITDQTVFEKKRDQVERFMESSIGHQHFVHGWPKDEQTRQKIAPQYIELLDSLTWLLYWRQARRPVEPSRVYDAANGTTFTDRDFQSHILFHEFLGLYTKNSLDKLFESMMRGDPAQFKNKYRFIGARAMKSDEKIQDQNSQGPVVPDWEMRSGNKGASRDFIENLIMARLSSGDYTGLFDFRVHKEFDPSASIRDLTAGILTPHQIETIEEFEREFPYMKWSARSNSYNHFRNKITAPLLDWNMRLNIGYKTETLRNAQVEYAKKLYELAAYYVVKLQGVSNTDSMSDLREDTYEGIVKAIVKFSAKVKLEEDFRTYLTPQPTEQPAITVAETEGQFDINNMYLGDELSFRFPEDVTNRTRAVEIIKGAAESFAKKMGGAEIKQLDDSGHGHGLSVRFVVTTLDGNNWRFEWDGISRSYKDADPFWARGGHLEVPTPKFAPQDPSEIFKLYEACIEVGLRPKRYAGGAHKNVDLSQFTSLPANIGARKLVDLINYFEKNRALISFIWQHPFRTRVALPVEQTPELVKGLNDFNGNWKDLALLLYTKRYFNPYVGRKPRYIQFNVTSLITPAAPKQYRNDLGNIVDIKNPTQTWFPEFGTGAGRVEFRLFDAMENASQEALQIKYLRAMLNYTLNKSKKISLVNQYHEVASTLRWLEDPAQFLTEAKKHLDELELSYDEYLPILIQSWEIQANSPPPKREDLIKFTNYLPPVIENSLLHDKKKVEYFVLNRGARDNGFKKKFFYSYWSDLFSQSDSQSSFQFDFNIRNREYLFY